MNQMIDHAAAADLMRSNSGEWIELRRDAHNRIFAVLSKWRRSPPKPYSSGRFEFVARGLAHGTGETRLLARHVPITFDLATPPS